MSAVTIWQALESVLRDIDGIRHVQLGEPTTIETTPMLIVVYAGHAHPMRNSPPARNLVGFGHQFVIRLALDTGDNGQAEMQLLTLVDQIPLALDAAGHLNGALSRGIAAISDAATGYADYSKKRYRIADFTATIKEKREGT